MPGPSNSGRSGGNKKKDGKMDQFKEVCPPHKLKDLDALVKSLNGNEDKIMEKIQEWWEEPPTVEPEWEDVNKKAIKKTRSPQGRGGGGRNGPGRGRGFHGRVGGRGAGPERRASGGRSGERRPANAKQDIAPEEDGVPVLEETIPSTGVPVPVAVAPSPKGAWGHAGGIGGLPTTVSVPQASVPAPKPEKPVPPPKPEHVKPVEVVLVTTSDPTPSGVRGIAPVEKPIRVPVPASGNVWATKGSAHIIQAEKPKPPTPHMRLPLNGDISSSKPQSKPVEIAVEETKESLEPKEISPQEPSPEAALENGLPASVNGSNINATGWNPSSQPLLDMGTSSVVETSLASLVPDLPAVHELPPPPKPSVPRKVPAPQPAPVPTTVLNMGHWESGEGDDSQNLDFGFGSFGHDNDTADDDIISSVESKDATNTSTVSPARPPPGLSIGGMPPLPANAVLVHELENKLESANLGQNVEENTSAESKPINSNLPATSQVPHYSHPESGVTPIIPQGGMSQNYNTPYMGMYNYNGAGNGFMGVHTPAGPVLAGGVMAHQKPQSGISGPQQQNPPTGGPQHLPQQGGLYSTASVGNAGNENNSSPPDNSTGVPPTMPGAMAYNPALFYGQQPYQMGQPHGGVGYGYAYGAQFGGVQGGFGYQQVMGQSGGYGYDEQAQPGNTGGYQKNNSGGYRGRNAHHNSGNQYQSQYNPQQHGGYGGQPYTMGYNVDHFNQRGGYGPGNMDPYAMQQQQQQGSGTYPSAAGIPSFQEDDHHKTAGKKGGNGRNNGSNLQQQFQQHPQQLGGQQAFGLQGGHHGGATDTSSSTNGGWSNQGGGWGGPSWQGGN